MLHSMEDLGADSLDTVELVMALEEEFDLEIPDSDAEKIQTVQDALELLRRECIDSHIPTIFLRACRRILQALYTYLRKGSVLWSV